MNNLIDGFNNFVFNYSKFLTEKENKSINPKSKKLKMENIDMLQQLSGLYENCMKSNIHKIEEKEISTKDDKDDKEEYDFGDQLSKFSSYSPLKRKIVQKFLENDTDIDVDIEKEREKQDEKEIEIKERNIEIFATDLSKVKAQVDKMFVLINELDVKIQRLIVSNDSNHSNDSNDSNASDFSNDSNVSDFSNDSKRNLNLLKYKKLAEKEDIKNVLKSIQGVKKNTKILLDFQNFEKKKRERNSRHSEYFEYFESHKNEILPEQLKRKKITLIKA